MYKKAIPILFVAFVLVVGACSHSSQSESSPTVTLSDTEWERVTAERDRELAELEQLGGSASGANLDFIPNYGFAPNTPEWNTAVVREAEKNEARVTTFANCSSLDFYYDFEKFSVGPIEKVSEIILRYHIESLFILNWSIIDTLNLYTDHPLSNFDTSNLPEYLPEEEKAILENLPQTELESMDNFGQFYEEVRAELADIIGDTTLRGLVADFTYVIIPLLKEDFASIGIESGRLEPSKFQDIWEANPELEEYVKDSLEFIENAEIELTEFLGENGVAILDFISALSDSLYFTDSEASNPIAESLILATRDTLEESFSIQPPAGCPEFSTGNLRFLPSFG